MSNVIRHRRSWDSRLDQAYIAMERAEAQSHVPARPRRLLYWVAGVLFIVVYAWVLL